MKKLISVLLSIIAAAGLCFGVAGCKQLTEQEKLEKEIKQDYIEFYNRGRFGVKEKSVLLKYLGCYNDSHAVEIFDNKWLVGSIQDWEPVGIALFEYYTTLRIEIYHANKFYSVPEAYELGLITNNDLRQIAEETKTKLRHIDVQYLSELQETAIKNDFIKFYGQDLPDTVDADDVLITAYYDTYFRNIEPYAYSDVISLKVGDSKYIKTVYNKGTFYTLDEAKEEQLISCSEYDLILNYMV